MSEFERFVKVQAEAEARADFERSKGQRKAPKRLYKFSHVALEQARLIFSVNQHFIINPRFTEAQSLRFADTEWISDLARYLSEYEYQKAQAEKKYA